MVTINTAKKLEGINFDNMKFLGIQRYKYACQRCACGRPISTACILVDKGDEGYVVTDKDENGNNTEPYHCYTSAVHIGSECIKHVAGHLSVEMAKAMRAHQKVLTNEVLSDPETSALRTEAVTTYFKLSNFLRSLSRIEKDPVIFGVAQYMQTVYHNVPRKPSNIRTAQAAYRIAIDSYKGIAAPYLTPERINSVVAIESFYKKAEFLKALTDTMNSL